MLTQERLKELFEYNPETGCFVRAKPAGGRPAGEKAGYLFPQDRATDYWRCKVDGKAYLAHRLAFLYMTGRLPSGLVDHINGDGLDNRWQNLREVDDIESARNRKVRRTSRSGLSGVCWHKRIGKWSVSIGDRSIKKHLGYFDSLLDAAAARKSAEIDLDYHENHGRRAA